MNFLYIIPILLILFGTIPAYADHPDAIHVTLDKESYEFGDTIFGTAQLVAPWDSVEGHTTSVNTRIFGDMIKSELNLETGIITFNSTLTSITLSLGTYTFTPSFTTIEKIPNDSSDRNWPIHHYGQLNTITLNSDHDSTLLKHMEEITTLNSTDTEYARMFDHMYSEMDSSHEDMTLLNNTTLSNELEIIRLNSLVTSLNNSNIQIKLDYELLKNEVDLGLGLLSNFNFTLGELYPVELNENDRSQLFNVMSKLADSVELEDKNISNFLVEIVNATLDDNQNKLTKYENSIGSSIGLRGYSDYLLRASYVFLDVYPQN